MKRGFLDEATEMASALLDATQNGGLFSRVSFAGLDYIAEDPTYEQYTAAWETYCDEPSDTNAAQLDVHEKKIFTRRTQNYKCFECKGDDQVSWLKAMDFFDEITPDLRLYNVCRAKSKDGPMGPESCGLAYPDASLQAISSMM